MKKIFYGKSFSNILLNPDGRTDRWMDRQTDGGHQTDGRRPPNVSSPCSMVDNNYGLIPINWVAKCIYSASFSVSGSKVFKKSQGLYKSRKVACLRSYQAKVR